MKSINGTFINGEPVSIERFPNKLTYGSPVSLRSLIPYVASGTVTLASGETVQCMEIGRTRNGYARLILADGREIKTNPAMYREAGSVTPFFGAFPFARIPGMVPIVAE